MDPERGRQQDFTPTSFLQMSNYLGNEDNEWKRG